MYSIHNLQVLPFYISFFLFYTSAIRHSRALGFALPGNRKGIFRAQFISVVQLEAEIRGKGENRDNKKEKRERKLTKNINKESERMRESVHAVHAASFGYIHD